MATQLDRSGINRTHWKWTPEQDIALVRRRYIDGAMFKQIAAEFGPSEPVVVKRYNQLFAMLEETEGDVVRRHREEELELLRRVLDEGLPRRRAR